MKVEIRDVIKRLQAKSDGSLIFAVAIACLEEADKQSEVLKVIKEHLIFDTELGDTEIEAEHRKTIPNLKGFTFQILNDEPDFKVIEEYFKKV